MFPPRSVEVSFARSRAAVYRTRSGLPPSPGRPREATHPIANPGLALLFAPVPDVLGGRRQEPIEGTAHTCLKALRRFRRA
jgi:hypothetical protein